MKKTILFVLLALILIIIIITINVSQNMRKAKEISSFNEQFETYKEKTIYGADILTIINKAIDNNNSHNIKKDENGNYIEDDKYSIKIELVLLTEDEKGNKKEVTHPMETLEKAGLDGFIANFSLTEFKCEKIEYNKEKRVSQIQVKQVEI